MIVVRKDFEIKLNMNEITALKDTQCYLIRLLEGMGEQLSEDEKVTVTYSNIENVVNDIVVNINNFLNLPEIILD